MTGLRKELADVKTLCQQLMNSRHSANRLVTPPPSEYQLQASASTASLARLSPIATSATTASTQSTASLRNNRFRGSTTSIASSYWAASIIDLYCSELEEISGLASAPHEPGTAGSSTVAITTHSSHPVGSRSLSRETRIVAAGRSALRLLFPNPWVLVGLPIPAVQTFMPAIMPTTLYTDNKYFFSGMAFYPAPELVPGAFSPVPGPEEAVVEKDNYVRRGVEQNTAFVISQTLKVEGNLESMADKVRDDFNVSLGIMKNFWLCHALYRLDPLSPECARFTSTPLPNVSRHLLRTYGFLVPRDSLRLIFSDWWQSSQFMT